MKTMEDMAREINRLNAEKKDLQDVISYQKNEISNLFTSVIALESLVYRLRFHVDLDGDVIIYNHLISHSEPAFSDFMTAVGNYKKRWGITGETF